MLFKLFNSRHYGVVETALAAAKDASAFSLASLAAAKDAKASPKFVAF